jgi:cytochrome c oxidase cbb3-type subunit I/II
MPAYPWLYSATLDTSLTQAKIKAFSTLGAPYSDSDISNAVSELKGQASQIASELVDQGVKADESLGDKEIIALIAYLQRLGTDIKPR